MSGAPRGSTVELSRFNGVFFEECAEHLLEMERILLCLESGDSDPEQLNALFRAAHSIKGGAGIFGFDDMAEITHHLESLLDRVRGGEIPCSRELVDLFLESGDLIALQLAGHRDGAEVAPERVRAMLGRLQDLSAATNSCAAKHSRPDSREESRSFSFTFAPDREFFRRGARMEGIVAELAELGELTVIASLAGPCDLSSFDPEACITRWSFTLKGTVAKERILEVFMFVAEEEELLFEQADAGLRGVPPVPLTVAAQGAESDASIRVAVAKVDQLVNQVGELLITQAMLVQSAEGLDPVRHEALHRSLALLQRNSRDLQQSVMSIRLVPIDIVFHRFPRMVRELSARLGKSVQVRTFGGSTELDKGLIEKIADPLSHLVRNALDHGLESPQERRAAGKPETGTIELRAAQVGGRIVVEVTDDGRGLNRETILAKARERGLPCSPDFSDEEVWQLVFAPGFSTASEVTDLSGRGVGMDVVLKNVQSIGGRVQVVSQEGKGARVAVSLPLTLAIQEALCVAVGAEKFLIPLGAVVESLQPRPEQLLSMGGKPMVQVRDEYFPVIPLCRLLGPLPEKRAHDGILVLVESDGERGALLVDALLDQLQVVVKSMEKNFRKVEGSSGATILGDGKVALILDVAELLALHKQRGAPAPDKGDRFSDAAVSAAP